MTSKFNTKPVRDNKRDIATANVVAGPGAKEHIVGKMTKFINECEFSVNHLVRTTKANNPEGVIAKTNEEIEFNKHAPDGMIDKIRNIDFSEFRQCLRYLDEYGNDDPKNPERKLRTIQQMN